jgi:molybdenum cofactor guanylyltransferase
VDRSAIILAGGSSSGFGQDKGLIEVNGKPLISHVVDAVLPIVDEVIVVTNSQSRADAYEKILGPHIKFAIDVEEGKGPLVGALTGFEAAHQKYVSLLTYDMPFVSSNVVELLFELGVGKSAAVPRWPNGEIEPFHAVYNRAAALEAATMAVNEGKLDVDDMVEVMRGVRYVSTLVIQELDPEFKTFFSVNTPLDLKRAAVLAKPRKTKTKSREFE